MTERKVTVVRVYLGERDGHLHEVLAYLRDEARVRGWTVYRGVSGFGPSGRVRTASLADLALDLPVTVEFFEAPETAAAIVAHLSARLGPGHVIHWPATMCGE
jgi:PII-like signaling protein